MEIFVEIDAYWYGLHLDTYMYNIVERDATPFQFQRKVSNLPSTHASSSPRFIFFTL